jgi:hypothetical protein
MNNIKIQINDSLISIIELTFCNRNSTTVKTKPCRIKFNGKFITTESKKTVWRNIGFAKSALLNHINCQSTVSQYLKSTYNVDYTYGTVNKQLIRDLETAGVIEYIEVDVESLAVQKMI